MTTDKDDVWIVDLDDVESRFVTKADAMAHVAGLEQLASGRLSVMIDRGPVVGWRRFVFGVSRWRAPCLSVEWYSGYASLIFHDENWSEYRAIDSECPVQPSEDVRLKIAHGELEAHPVIECLEKSRAFTAIRAYLTDGNRPTWLKYKFVN